MKTLLLLSLALAGFVSINAQTAGAKITPTTESDETAKLSREVVRLYKAAKYGEAVPIAKQAIEAREKELGPNHLLVAQAWRNLAYIELGLSKQKDASKAFDKAFDIYEKNQPLAPADERIFAEMLEAVAVYDAVDGQVDKSEKRLLRAIEISERLNGVNAEKTASPLLHLAEVYEAAGDYEKAEPLLKRTFDIRTKGSVVLNDETFEIYQNLYCTLTKLDLPDEAKQLEDKYEPRPAKEDGKKVNAGVLNGKALSLPKPTYPAAARSAGARGKVEVNVLINESGKVVFACAINGAKQLQRVSEISAYGSKFSPTLLKGEPVKVKGIVTYNFIP